MASQRELVKELFGAALDLDPEERAAFLERECKGDLDLRRDVEALLDANAMLEAFCNTQFCSVPTATFSEADLLEIIIGPYHLLELVGEVLSL